MSEGPGLRKFYVNKFLSDEFVKRLKAGWVPWRRPWVGNVPLQNGESGHRYQGLNVFQLTVASIENDFRQPYWLTRNQAHKRGGEVRPEHRQNGTLFVFYKDFTIQETLRAENPKTGEVTDEPVERTIPLLRYGTLFNVAQCHGFRATDLPAYKAGQRPAQAERHSLAAPGDEPAALAFLKRAPGLPTDLVVSDEAGEAFYDAAAHAVVMPPPPEREREAAFAFCLFKAVIAAAGPPQGPDRPGFAGSRDALREDLIAELGAGLLCGHVGVRPPQEVPAGTVQGWIQALNNDPRLLLRAGIQAQKAVALVLGKPQAQTQAALPMRPVNGAVPSPPLPEPPAQASPEPTTFTALDVIYRDVANYKQFEGYVVEGDLSFQDLEPYLEDGVHFVGKDVQMEDLAFRFVERDGMDLNADDQPWQAIEAVEPTTADLAAEAKREGRFLGTAADVLERFKRAAQANWPGRDEVAARMQRFTGLDPQPIYNEAERQGRAIGY